MNTSDEIQSLIKTTIEAQVVRALNEAPEAIDKLIHAALQKPVDENGQPARYSSDKNMPFLEWMVGNEIRLSAGAILREVIESREDDIRTAILAALTADTIVDGMIEALLGAMRQDWRLSVTFLDGKRS